MEYLFKFSDAGVRLRNPIVERSIAVVTGAAQGIGAGIARRLAADGYRVAVLDLACAKAAEVAEELGGIALCCDVSDPVAVRAAAAELGPVEVLVNNAAVAIHKSLLDSSDVDLQSVVAVNLLGTAYCCRAFAPAMIAQGRGSIVSISSVVSRTASPGFGVTPATKTAIEALTRQLALEWIQTERNTQRFQGDMLKARQSHVPLGRTGLPSDVADVVSALCSEDMRYVTGQVLYVDGGMSAGVGPV